MSGFGSLDLTGLIQASVNALDPQYQQTLLIGMTVTDNVVRANVEYHDKKLSKHNEAIRLRDALESYNVADIMSASGIAYSQHMLTKYTGVTP